MSIVIGRDATGANEPHLPPGQAAGYVTGTGGVAWTVAQWAAHPGAVRIDQTPAGTQWDDTADVDDYENGAVQLDELAGRAKARQAAFAAGKRPGQRKPAVYVSADNVTAVVSALLAGGVRTGAYLWIAHWGLTESQGANLILDGSGPFPVIGVQISDNGDLDTDVFSSTWLDDVSGKPVPPPPPAPPVLREGDTGAWVATLQRDLNRHHASPPAAVDEVFGPRTLAAVEAFQREAKITVDGVVGPVTWKALGQT